MNKSWEYKKIGDVCTVERGGSPRPIDKFITDDENGINWIKIGDTTDSMYITHTAQKIIPEGMKKSRHVKPGDFLLSNSMSFGRPYILQIDGCIHDGWLVLRDDNELFDKRFLYYYLSSKTTYEKFKSMAVGGVVNNLNSEMVRKVEVPIPDKAEQSDVADLMDRLSKVIDDRKKELECFDELIKARFVELFGMPLDKAKANMKFTDCVEFNPKKSEVKDMQDLEVSFVPMECVGIDGSFTIRENGPVSNYYKGYTYFKDGDVLLAKITPCFENGKAAIAEGCKNGIGFGTTEFHVARPKKGVSNSYWIKYMLKNDSVHDLATINMTGSAGQKRIQTPFFDKLTIFCPSIELQNQFAEFVKQVDKSKFV
ncbi:MAG: hypothetical protein E7275_03245 [Pseudobutyrivibrio sp.]|uniref:restriction endonuclease subunit S n=1 Tax=Pseudobutyrivibrio sp. TaxID=2014367 RepID=UPI0025F4E791|nr:restriction endonuclease subunit S [Pseudobutyrivibrio sp.]MBE5903282.1 hypothetical protein [Pseudobutyrivibrio sp.]